VTKEKATAVVAFSLPKTALTGLEPVISALRGRRVNQLHHSALTHVNYKFTRAGLAAGLVTAAEKSGFECVQCVHECVHGRAFIVSPPRRHDDGEGEKRLHFSGRGR
jgi:hypothetical protein